MGWWKTEETHTMLQHYVVYYLHSRYSDVDAQTKINCNKFDKFLLSFFFTLNSLKTHNKRLRNFSNFINDSYTIG